MPGPHRPIQTSTAGLLSLLSINNVGQNPDILEGNVQPALEMVPWWLRGNSAQMRALFTSVIADFAFQPVEFQASPNEWLYLEMVQGEASGAAAVTDGGLHLYIYQASLTSFVLWRGPFIERRAFSTTGFGAHWSERGVWVPPGFGLGLISNGDAGDFVALSGYGFRIQV